MAFATIGTKGITDATIATADIADNAVTSAKTSGIPARPNAQALIINGDMGVAQRGTSTASVTTASYPACDRWNFAISSGGTWTVSQDTDVPSGEGFLTSTKYDCTTAQGTLGSAAYIQHRQSIEGQNLQVLKKGTSNAEKVTISFWVKATKTGTNILELYDNTNNRQCSKAYTISSSDTWEKKVVNFPGDTSGALANNNSGALNVQFYLGAGSDLSSGTLQTTWAGYVNVNRAVGQVNHADSTSNNFYITGVQMEVGEFTSSTIPPFQHEEYGDNLHRCERYFQVVAKDVDQARLFNGFNFDGTNTETVYNFFPQMRSSPSINQTTGTSYFEFRCNNSNTAMTSFSGMDNPGKHAVRIYGAGGGGSSAGQAGAYRLNNVSAQVCLESEL